MLCLRDSQNVNSWKMLSTLPKKLTKKGFLTATILQLSVIIQEQKRVPLQSNPWHEQAHWCCSSLIQQEVARENQSLLCEHWRSSCWYLYQKSSTSIVWEVQDSTWTDIMKMKAMISSSAWLNVFNSSIRLQIVMLGRLLMTSNIRNPKTMYYLHRRGSV